MSGIRFDWQDLPEIIEALSQVADGLNLYGQLNRPVARGAKK